MEPINIKVTLTCDDTITQLVDAVCKVLHSDFKLDKDQAAIPTAAPAQNIPAAPAPQVINSTPVAPTLAAPAAPAPVVPTAPAKQYSLEDLLTAAGPLIDQGKTNELIALTKKYGVQSFNEIPVDKYGAVAVDLRALGAKL